MPIHGQHTTAMGKGSSYALRQQFARGVVLVVLATPLNPLGCAPCRAVLVREGYGLFGLDRVLDLAFCKSPVLALEGGEYPSQACLIYSWRHGWALLLWRRPWKPQTDDF